jgi:hypothetical protein
LNRILFFISVILIKFKNKKISSLTNSGKFESAIVSESCSIKTSKVALSCGSSKQGKALRASVGSNLVAITVL